MEKLWETIWRVLSEDWRVMRQNWKVYLAFQAVVVLALWAIFNWHFSGMIETDDTTIQSQLAMIESLKDTLDGEGPLQVQRHLTETQKKCLISNLSGSLKDFILLPNMAIYSVPGEEQEIYASDFYTLFTNMGFKAVFIPDSIPEHDNDSGVIVGLANPENPSKNALKVENALLSCGFAITTEPSSVSAAFGALDFDIFINNRPDDYRSPN